MYFKNYYVIMYQPLPVLTFALNYHYSQLSPLPLHLINVLFHLANILLVYRFVMAITENRIASLIIALLFGIHPMNVEAVTWISARSSSMYTCFYLLALNCYLNYLKKNFPWKYLIFLGLFFVLSLFSKAQAVTLPLVMLLLDYYYERNLFSLKTILEKIPFFTLSIVFGLITLHDPGTMHNLSTGVTYSYSAIDIPFIVCHSILFYLVKFLFPVNLCAIYLFPVKINGFLPWTYYASALLLIAIIVLLIKARKKRKIIFAVGLFFITIAINIQIIPSRLFEVTDRYGYFPYIGLFLLLYFLFQELTKKNVVNYSKQKNIIIPFAVVLMVFFAYSVRARNEVWKNDETLMTDIIQKNPPTEYIRRAYGNRGMYYKSQARFAEAIDDFTQAAKLKPDDPISYFNRGLTYFTMNNSNDALKDFDRVVELNPQQPIVYTYRLQARLVLQDTTGALADGAKAIQLDSANAENYNNLATIFFARKQYDLCQQYLTRAIHFKPNFSLAYKNRGLLQLQLGKKPEGCSDLQYAYNLGDADAGNLMGQYCKH